MIFLGVRIDGELEKEFLSEESEKHRERAELLRAILKEHYDIKANPVLYLVKLPQFQKLLGIVVKANATIEAEKAKVETAKKLAEIKEEQKKQAALDRAVSHEPKVDWGGSEGGGVHGDEDFDASTFMLGDR